jgi:hypothetical protein
VLAAESLQVRGRIDVSGRSDVLVGIEHLAEFAPGALDFRDVGHVRHRAAGCHVGQDGDLSGLGQDVRDFGHEMHPAEHDVLGVGLRSQLGKLQRIARQVGVPVNIGALVVVGENGDPLAELFPGGNDARLAVIILQAAVQIKGGCGGWHGGGSLSAPEHDWQKPYHIGQ